MELTKTEIKLVNSIVRWASARVADRRTGQILFDLRLTAEEESDLRLKGIVSSQLQEDWKDPTKLVIVSGRHLNPGLALEMDDGSLILNYGEIDSGQRLEVFIAQLPPTDWSKDTIDDSVSVRSDKADELTRAWRKNPLPIRPKDGSNI